MEIRKEMERIVYLALLVFLITTYVCTWLGISTIKSAFVSLLFVTIPIPLPLLIISLITAFLYYIKGKDIAVVMIKSTVAAIAISLPISAINAALKDHIMDVILKVIVDADMAIYLLFSAIFLIIVIQMILIAIPIIAIVLKTMTEQYPVQVTCEDDDQDKQVV